MRRFIGARAGEGLPNAGRLLDDAEDLAEADPLTARVDEEPEAPTARPGAAERPPDDTGAAAAEPLLPGADPARVVPVAETVAEGSGAREVMRLRTVAELEQEVARNRAVVRAIEECLT